MGKLTVVYGQWNFKTPPVVDCLEPQSMRENGKPKPSQMHSMHFPGHAKKTYPNNVHEKRCWRLSVSTDVKNEVYRGVLEIRDIDVCQSYADEN